VESADVDTHFVIFIGQTGRSFPFKCDG